ncbi:hypothetical protein [Caballeronia udeis]|uniref:hypothetical protein n=1 Tax=Caballeronia udeis TaxID=1232866 RepID=UPI000780BCB6|nr:hypothetical protein [Caballeronia udeis]
MKHALKLNASLARTGFGRRASHAGSGEKYIKFVRGCPAAAYRVRSTRLPRTLRPPQPSYETSAISIYSSLRTVRISAVLFSPANFTGPPLFTARPSVPLNAVFSQSLRFKRRCGVFGGTSIHRLKGTIYASVTFPERWRPTNSRLKCVELRMSQSLPFSVA